MQAGCLYGPVFTSGPKIRSNRGSAALDEGTSPERGRRIEITRALKLISLIPLVSGVAGGKSRTIQPPLSGAIRRAAREP